jgi:DNA invertase Pin-like site-specific DNA recombinase/DNA-binding winged helix-turn-helix (wHTH) protein
MEPKPLVPAAQYVRMSTEDQQYSIANQKVAINAYAKGHGYVVISTYADTGKSGVKIKHRHDLRRLLSDVVSGQAQFKAILVYDVSRWGRFQDVDEAAHYEFLCRSAGIPVRYCAEQFENDGSAASAIMKALKRTMAAEYSRELGVKVLAGQRRIALLGYRSVGTAGYGLRRMMVSPDGRRRLVLQNGERKAVHTDRTILVPGPKKEVSCIRRMFELAFAGSTPKEIAKELNVHHMLTANVQLWRASSVYRILTNEKYAGGNTYGKTTQRLSSVSRVVERDLWVTHPDAFVSIVAREVFDRVQKFLTKRGLPPTRSDAYLIQGMRKVLNKEGKLTHRILKTKSRLGCAYFKRFGSILKAYEVAGYQPPPGSIRISDAQSKMRLLRKDLYVQLKRLFSDRLRFINLPGQKIRQVVEIDGRLRLAVYLCHAVIDRAGELGWSLRVRPLDRHLPMLLCTVDQSFSQLLNFYVSPPLETSLKWKILRQGQPSLSAARKLGKLEDFCDFANEVAEQSKNCEGRTTVDDILVASDTWTITLDQKDILLGPTASAIFNMLVLHAGEVVSRDRLQRAISDYSDPSDIDAHIHKLRLKLGVDNRKRIQTVKGIGYIYVSPGRRVDAAKLEQCA